MIICDTREKKNDHILDYFNRHGIQYGIDSMKTGDYMDSDKPELVIDRKQNLDELRQNLCSRDKNRFWREVRRAKDEGRKLVILCEHGDGIKALPDVRHWISEQNTKVTGRQLYNEAFRCHIGYGVEFLFCEKSETAKRIIEILGGGLE